MKRVLASILTLTMVLSILAACAPAEGGGEPAEQAVTPPPAQGAAPADVTPAAPGTPMQGGTLITGGAIIDAQLAANNPFLPHGQIAIAILDYIYERLLFMNVVSGELEPMLATGFEWGPDYLSLIFTIREGVVWHDGAPFGPDDVVFTFGVLRDYPIFDRHALWSHIRDVRAEGNTVVFDLHHVFLSLPFFMDEIRIVPRHLWENLPDASLHLNETPVGTGPFIWRSHTVGTEVHLDANPYYYLGAPIVDDMLFLLYNNTINLSLALLNGDLHWSHGISVQFVPEFRNAPYAVLQNLPGLNVFVVNLNHEHELLADPAVRRAMAMAINQYDLRTRVEHGVVFPQSIGFLPDAFGDYVSREAMEALNFDPAGAIEVLEEAGYVRGSDGIFAAPDGNRLSFTYHNQTASPSQQMAAGMIQQWLLNIGIEILPRLGTGPELTHLQQTGQFELIQRHITVPPDPIGTLNSVFHSSMTAPTGYPTPGLNFFRYRNPAVDALLDEAVISTDQARRMEIAREIQMILAEDTVFLPMYGTGPRFPHFRGLYVGGWRDDAPIVANRNIIYLYLKQR